ncbi:MAG: sporulation membrane protein YtaF [Peptococcaceae bacterium]|nr:sporulation membrane protein YtaF [Peptococcaceae bacterium]
MDLAILVIFGFALSLDGFVAGLTYGIRQINIPVISVLIISVTSGIAISLSLVCGHLTASIIAPKLAEQIGGLLLIGLGFWVLTQAIRSATEKVLRIHIPQLGMVIQVLFEPLHADMDQSGCISPREAVILGIALAMDAFAAGFAIALSGFQTALVPVFTVAGLFCLLILGTIIGRRSKFFIGHKVNFLPGCLFIILGMLRLFHEFIG